MNNAWENLNKTWRERLKSRDAMQAAVQYQDTLQVRAERDCRGHTGAMVSLSSEWVTFPGLQHSQTRGVRAVFLASFPLLMRKVLTSKPVLPCFSLHAYPIIYPHGGYRVKLALLSKSLLLETPN